MGMRTEHSVQLIEPPGVNHLRIEADPVDGISPRLLAHSAVIELGVHGWSTVLVDEEDTPLIRLEHPGGAAAPPQAYLSLGHLIGFNLLVEEGPPLREAVFQPLGPVDGVILVDIGTRDDAPSVTLRYVVCHSNSASFLDQIEWLVASMDRALGRGGTNRGYVSG